MKKLLVCSIFIFVLLLCFGLTNASLFDGLSDINNSNDFHVELFEDFPGYISYEDNTWECYAHYSKAFSDSTVEIGLGIDGDEKGTTLGPILVVSFYAESNIVDLIGYYEVTGIDFVIGNTVYSYNKLHDLEDKWVALVHNSNKSFLKELADTSIDDITIRINTPTESIVINNIDIEYSDFVLLQNMAQKLYEIDAWNYTDIECEDTIEYFNDEYPLSITENIEIKTSKYKEYSYEELFRYSDDHFGEPVKITGYVIEAQYAPDEDSISAYRVATKGQSSNIFLVTDENTSSHVRILEGDRIIVKGTFFNTYTYTNVLGGSVTIPWVNLEEFEFWKASPANTSGNILSKYSNDGNTEKNNASDNKGNILH